MQTVASTKHDPSVRACGGAVLGVGDGNGRNGVRVTHKNFFKHFSAKSGSTVLWGSKWGGCCR
jgi:hypothetical protein